MRLHKIGELDIHDMTLVPNYIDQSDYSYMVFDLSENTKLIVSCLENIVVLRCRRDEFVEELRGTITDEEQAHLKSLFFREDIYA